MAPHLLPALLTATALAAELPKHYTVSQQVFANGLVFEIRTGERKLGRVRGKAAGREREFAYDDGDDKCVARARTRSRKDETRVEVRDCDGRAIGVLRERVDRSRPARPRTLYSFLDPSDKELAVSEKGHWGGGPMLVKDSTGTPACQIYHPRLAIGESVEVEVESAALDPRMIAVAAVYKTHVDGVRRREADALP